MPNVTLPSISIVTPSYNQGTFLRSTIESVLNQDYPNLEYVIMDGGSTDGSVEIIKEYTHKITHWESGPDGGHYPALNKGFAKTTGEIMAWLNSDDMYMPWAFSVAAEIFSKFPQVEWLTTAYPLIWDKTGRAVDITAVQRSGYARQGFLHGENIPPIKKRFATNVIEQESTFWRRRLWERAGGKLDESLSLAADFALWANFFQSAELYTVQTALGGFRVHEAQKTAHFMDDYIAEAERVLKQYGGHTYNRWESTLRRGLLKYLPMRVAYRIGWKYKTATIQYKLPRHSDVYDWEIVRY